jgi:hypothetical protein
MPEKNIFKKIKAFFRGLNGRHYEIGQKPDFDWLVVLNIFIVFNVLAVALVIYGLNSIDKNSSLGEASDNSSQQSDLIDMKLLGRVINHFEADKTELQKISNNPSEMIDPSE